MENCQQLAEPLALAVSTCLRKQEVEVNQAVLTSYLLDIQPDPEIPSQLELKNQIDSQGNYGNVSISLVKVEDRDCVKSGEGAEQLLVVGREDEKKGFQVKNANDEEFFCLSTEVSSRMRIK